MLKKIFLILAILFIPIQLQAISISDISENNNYLKVKTQNNFVSYINIDKTIVVMNSPTTTEIKTMIIGVDFSDATITTMDVIYTYNKDRSTSEIQKMLDDSNEPEVKVNPEYFINQLKLLDSGVISTKSNFEVFSFKGTLLSHDAKRTRKTNVDFRSLDYSIASAIYAYNFNTSLF